MTPAKTRVCCPECKRPLGDVIESLVRQRGRFKGQREQARTAIDEMLAALEVDSDWSAERLIESISEAIAIGKRARP